MYDSVNIEDDLSIIKSVYQKKDEEGQLEIIKGLYVKPTDLYEEWII